MYSFYCVATGLKNADLVFSFNFAGKGDSYVKSVLLPQIMFKRG